MEHEDTFLNIFFGIWIMAIVGIIVIGIFHFNWFNIIKDVYVVLKYITFGLVALIFGVLLLFILENIGKPVKKFLLGEKDE